MNTKLKLLLSLLLVITVQLSYSQERTVTGTVIDNTGIPLPGASILVKGTQIGTQTDFDGKYSIKVSSDQILIFSFIGMKTQEFKAISTKINVEMLESARSLDEVLVVAYGTQKKEAITGSISVIKSDKIENATFSNVAQSLEGLVSGLRITQADANPGSDPIIRIRGFGSINADSSPLIVLDGVPYSGSLSSINPQDIESTTVLKDASSTSLYGNKASNGVLLITTKKGKRNNKPQINFDTRYGITQRGSKEYNIIKNPKDFYEAYHSVLTNSEYYRQNADGNPISLQQARQFASDNLIDRLGYNVYNVADNVLVDPNTGKLNSSARLLVNDSWEDVLFRDSANFTSTNLNISGGNQDIDYYFSLGNEENNGYTVRSNFKRSTARLKVNATNIVKVISLSGDMSYAKSNSQAIPASFDPTNGTPSTNFSNAFGWTRRIAPIFPVYQYDANWNPIVNTNNPGGYAYDFGFAQDFGGGIVRGPRNYAPGEHPLAVIENTQQTNAKDNFNAAFRTKVDLPLGLKFEYVMNYLVEVDQNTDFTKPGAGAFALAQNGLLTNTKDNYSAFTNQQLLTWKKDFGVHEFDFLLGHETYEENFNRLGLTKYNIIGNFNPVLDNTSVYIGASNYNTKYVTEGYFSRFVYGLDNKYYLNLSGRYDASSVFHPDARWGAFWSAGGSWIMSKEKFMNESKAINYAKLSVNYGTTGNDRILYPDGFQTRNFTVYENQYEIAENNGQLTQTLKYLGNKDITWEKAASFDIAYNMSLFNRLNINVGYFRKTSKDLLFNNPIPLSTGQETSPRNFGTMVNSGIETEISWHAIKREKINLTFNANLSTLNNIIKELPRDNIQVGNFRRTVGRSIFDYYMVRSAGVNPENGNAQYFTKDDTTGEEIITEDYASAVTSGREFLNKQAIPEITGGFGADLQLGNFSVGLQFAYQLGGYGLDNEYFTLLGATQNITNFPDYHKTWTLENTTGSLPRVDPLSPNQYRISDMYLIDLSYLSLSNINLGYLLKNDALKRNHIESVKIYGIVNNGFLLYSARQGYDPRLSLVGSSSSEYGANRTIAFGVNVKLN